MKTTLNIDDTVMARLRRESARTGRTMSQLVEMALRGLLQERPEAAELEALPTFRSGGALVDIADREALYRSMRGTDFHRFPFLEPIDPLTGEP
jgi:hypothetical protein